MFWISCHHRNNVISILLRCGGFFQCTNLYTFKQAHHALFVTQPCLFPFLYLFIFLGLSSSSSIRISIGNLQNNFLSVFAIKSTLHQATIIIHRQVNWRICCLLLYHYTSVNVYVYIFKHLLTIYLCVYIYGFFISLPSFLF